MNAAGNFTGGVREGLLLALCAAALAGCTGVGSLSGHSQSCSFSEGILQGQTMSCEGTADTLGGRMGIEFGDGDDDLSGEYRLQASISVESGSARVYGGDEDVSLGSVSAGEPLTVDETVELTSGSPEVFTLDAGEGEEVGGLAYAGVITSQ